MILRPLSNFSGNGTLHGTIVALSDDGEPLGWEAFGNWSNTKFRADQAKDLAMVTGNSVDRTMALVGQALKAARSSAGLTDRTVGFPARHERPIIRTTRRYLREIASESWQVLDETGGTPRFYNFAGNLCEIVPAKSGTGQRPRLLSTASLRGHLDELADYVAVTDGDESPSRPPKDMLESMVALATPPVPVLNGISTTPVVTARGELLTTSGYHASTGLLLTLGDLEVPPVSDHPSPAELEEAVSLIGTELLGDFPFATDCDWTHAICALLNPFVRPLIAGPTPMFLIESPGPGSGKGLLAHVIARSSTGYPPRSMTEGNHEDEWRKRITGALADAAPVTLIDNVRRRLEAAALASVLTAEEWTDRLLGSTRIITVPVLTTWLATANNPALSDEIARRTVQIRLDPSVERPWERTGFKHDPLPGWVDAQRGRLAWSALTILQAWLSAGRPAGTQTMGSFEGWARAMGGIATVAGLPGFLDNREELYAAHEAEIADWRAFFDVWWANYADRAVDVGQLFDLAREHQLLGELRAGRKDHSARIRMGIFLGKMRDRVIGEFRVRWAGLTKDRRTRAYHLEMSPGSTNTLEHPQHPHPLSYESESVAHV